MFITRDLRKLHPMQTQTIVDEQIGDGSHNSISTCIYIKSVNEFEVFVAGKRLRKPQYKCLITLDQDSEADEILPLNFS